MDTYNFKVIITQDEDGLFVADCPAIPGCHTQAGTYEEAEKRIRVVITLCLNVAKKDPAYRSSINYGDKPSMRFIGMTEIAVPRASFV